MYTGPSICIWDALQVVDTALTMDWRGSHMLDGRKRCCRHYGIAYFILQEHTCADCPYSMTANCPGQSKAKVAHAAIEQALPDSCAACWMGRSAIALQCTMAEIILQTAHAASATTTGQQKPNATSMAVGQALPDGRTACWMGSTAKRLSLRLPSCWKASSSNTCRMPEHAFHDGCAPPNGCTACRRAGASLP